MGRAIEPVKIGSAEISAEELEALRTCRDYKRLRDMAGWHSDMIDKQVSKLKDLLGEEVTKNSNERTKKQGSHPESPFARRCY